MRYGFRIRFRRIGTSIDCPNNQLVLLSEVGDRAAMEFRHSLGPREMARLATGNDFYGAVARAQRDAMRETGWYEYVDPDAMERFRQELRRRGARRLANHLNEGHMPPRMIVNQLRRASILTSTAREFQAVVGGELHGPSSPDLVSSWDRFLRFLVRAASEGDGVEVIETVDTPGLDWRQMYAEFPALRSLSSKELDSLVDEVAAMHFDGVSAEELREHVARRIDSVGG